MNFNKNLSFSGFSINKESPVFIIAEAGVNHSGDIQLAKELVDIAFAAGADAVKFQAFRTEKLIIENIEKAPYQVENTGNSETQSQMLKKLELNKEAYIELKKYCENKGILFLITPFDEFSLTELEEIGVEAYKIASTDLTNLPFLKEVAKTKKVIFLSTGMSYMDEVEAALKEISEFNKDVVLLQCTANYPIQDEEANLNIINSYKEKFDVLVGYSDHSVGLGASPFAVPMGAKVVEKHFTLDKDADGPDHKASLSPSELKDYVKLIRTVEKYLGSSVKEPTKSEEFTRKSLQKCLVANKAINKGDTLTEDSFIAKRTGGNGISPVNYKKLIGLKASRDYVLNEIIAEEIG